MSFLKNIKTPDDLLQEYKEQKVSQVKSIRDDALRNLTHDFGDGRVIQVRPADFANDELNIRNAIERMNRLNITEQPWHMADNTTHIVSVADLEAAIVSGQDQGAAIWQAYFEELL